MNFMRWRMYCRELLAAEEAELPSDVCEKTDLAEPTTHLSRDQVTEGLEIAQNFASDSRKMSARRGGAERPDPRDAITSAGKRQQLLSFSGGQRITDLISWLRHWKS